MGALRDSRTNGLRQSRTPCFLAFFSVLVIVSIWFNTSIQVDVLDTESPQNIHVATRAAKTTEPRINKEDELRASPVANCPTLGPVPDAERGQVVLLASYPGSGNTWIRGLIQRSSGYWTGSAYNDKSLLSAFPGEGIRDSSVIVVKTHYPCTNCWPLPPRLQKGQVTRYRPVRSTGIVKAATGTVYVLRNPFDAILSEFHRVASGLNHTGRASDSMFHDGTWEEFAVRRAQSWTAHAEFYLNSKLESKSNTMSDLLHSDRMFQDTNGKPVYLIYYDLLRERFDQEFPQLMQAIREFHDGKLSIPETPIALACAQTGSAGFKRSSVTHNPYSADLVLQICEIVNPVWQRELWGEQCNGNLQWQRETKRGRV